MPFYSQFIYDKAGKDRYLHIKKKCRTRHLTIERDSTQRINEIKVTLRGNQFYRQHKYYRRALFRF